MVTTLNRGTAGSSQLNGKTGLCVMVMSILTVSEAAATC